MEAPPPRTKAAYSDIKEELDCLEVDVSFMVTYTAINGTGVEKILKKRAKNVAPYSDKVLPQSDDSAGPQAVAKFRADLDTSGLAKGEKLWTDLGERVAELRVSLKSLKAIIDEEDTVNQVFLRKTRKYFVRNEDLDKVVAILAEHGLTQFVFPGSPPNALITSIYFDTHNLEMYHRRFLRYDGATLVRFRWYVEWGASKVFVERKTHREGAPSLKERTGVHHKRMNTMLNRKNKAKIKTKDPLIQEIVPAIIDKKLRPQVRVRYNRIAYQAGNDDDSVRVSMDTNIHMSTLDYKKMHLHRMVPVDTHYLPCAILEVKLQVACPQWLTDLQTSDLLIDALQFSKYIHGTGFHQHSRLDYLNLDLVDFLKRRTASTSLPDDERANVSDAEEADTTDVDQDIYQSDREDKSDTDLDLSKPPPEPTKAPKKAPAPTPAPAPAKASTSKPKVTPPVSPAPPSPPSDTSEGFVGKFKRFFEALGGAVSPPTSPPASPPAPTSPPSPPAPSSVNDAAKTTPSPAPPTPPAGASPAGSRSSSRHRRRSGSKSRSASASGKGKGKAPAKGPVAALKRSSSSHRRLSLVTGDSASASLAEALEQATGLDVTSEAVAAKVALKRGKAPEGLSAAMSMESLGSAMSSPKITGGKSTRLAYVPSYRLLPQDPFANLAPSTARAIRKLRKTAVKSFARRDYSSPEFQALLWLDLALPPEKKEAQRNLDPPPVYPFVLDDVYPFDDTNPKARIPGIKAPKLKLTDAEKAAIIAADKGNPTDPNKPLGGAEGSKSLELYGHQLRAPSSRFGDLKSPTASAVAPATPAPPVPVAPERVE